MKDSDYLSIASAIRRKLLLDENLSKAESEALNRQLEWLESLRKPLEKTDRPQA